jgi:hypothetical protein
VSVEGAEAMPEGRECQGIGGGPGVAAVVAVVAVVAVNGMRSFLDSMVVDEIW